MSAISQFAMLALLGTSASVVTFSVEANAQSQAPASTPGAVVAEPSQAAAAPSPAGAAPAGAAPAAPKEVGSTTQASAGAAETMPAPAAPAAEDDAPRTLLGRGSKHSFGGFGGVDAAYTRLAGHDAAMVCGEGAFLLDHAFSIGGAGCGLVSNIGAENYGDVAHAPGDRLAFAYGGVTVKYQFLPREIVNVAVGALIGGGGVAVTERWDGTHDHDETHAKSTDAVFVVEPRVSGFLNIARWSRVGVFGGYRFVSGSNTKNLTSEDLSGPTVGASVHFGWM